jgi:FkbM family methyltransferase
MERLPRRWREIWFWKVRLPLYLRRIRPGDVVVDAGAHVGHFTRLFAARGARVYAFEPHPAAFAALALRTRELPNVTCINKAVWDAEGRVALYFHKSGSGLEWSESASLLAAKRNVDPASFVTVEAVRLADVVAELAPVRFLKMDIEGAEYRVLTDLIGRGLHRRIDRIAVETHERSPALSEAHRALTGLIRRERVRNVDMSWL